MSYSFKRLAFQGLKAYTQRTLGYTDASELILTYLKTQRPKPAFSRAAFATKNKFIEISFLEKI